MRLSKRIRSFIKLLRCKQYLKNILIFAPIFFSFNFYELSKLLFSVYAFIIFSMAASGIYILNDIFDLEEDKLHPEKKNRPITSGDINISTGYFLMSLLIIPAIFLSYIINVYFFFILVLYVFINFLYSLSLKHVALLDIIIIAIGFLLRIFAGGIVTNISISMWLIIMTFLLSVFLGFAKRREDVRLLEKGLRTRKNVDGYNLEFINATMILMAGVIVVSYILYTVSVETQIRFQTHNLYITSLFVIIGFLRYMQLTFVEERSGNPTNLVYEDRFLQLTILCWIFSFVLIVKIAS